MNRSPFLPGLLVMIGLIATTVQASPAYYDQTTQTAALLRDEAQTVYLANLARREHGVPPLRWNQELTRASRWFGWDSVENRSAYYCGHQDTQGNWPNTRALNNGYLGFASAENAFCSYVTPQQAVNGWLNSPAHHDSLISSSHRETGLGYYRRASDGRGYVVELFGSDPVYAPVVIENDAPETNSQNVNLYIYSASGGDFLQMGAAQQMQVSNGSCSNGAWEPYNPEKAWQLTAGNGWKVVTVKTRDSLNRTATSTDAIYLGGTAPLESMPAEGFASTSPTVTLYGLNPGAMPSMQLSAGWIGDDSFANFGVMTGTPGTKVNDSAAWGGTTYQVPLDSSAWVWTTTFMKNTPLVAYFRLKVSNNTSPYEVARVSVSGGGTEYGPLSIRGTDFSAANTYQEFAVPFTFKNGADPFLIFKVWRSATAEVYADAVTIFTAPLPAASTYTWTYPGGNYRGQGVWVRYSNAAGQFTGISEALLSPPKFESSSANLGFIAATGKTPPPSRQLSVSTCPAFSWQAQSSASWLGVQVTGSQVQVTTNPTGLAKGVYNATIILAPGNPIGATALEIPVTLRVADNVYQSYFPTLLK